MTLRQAQRLLRLDIHNKIAHSTGFANRVHIWGFPHCSPKTADVESDLWTTLRSLDIGEPDYICRNEQVDRVEQSLRSQELLLEDIPDTDSAACVTSGNVKDFLQTHSAETLRLSVLLECDDATEQPEAARQFYRQFVSSVDNYVTRHLGAGCDSETADCDTRLLQILDDQESRHLQFLTELKTRKALDVLWESIIMLRPFLEETELRPSGAIVLAAKVRILRCLASLGVTLDPESTRPATDGRMASVVDAVASFRQEVRSFALEDKHGRLDLITACDRVRYALLKAGVKLQDSKKQVPWLWTVPKT